MNYDELTNLPPMGEINTERFGRIYGLRTSNLVEASFFSNVLFALLDIEVEKTETGKTAVFIINGNAVDYFLEHCSPEELMDKYDDVYFEAAREMLAKYADELLSREDCA